MYLSLPLKASRKNCSLAECLELFTAAEEVSGEDKWCDKRGLRLEKK